ncbi:17231_t:CDS:2 [Dentiscutata erythropus]|uniref:17231_t:CDS:1 n=1 Tax=Dentiscutata erythropus TaxID=1348616 RepID=A0A9N9EKA8_9GLOM|nr:17231_t:CDS:2 [Dentiscutata erythropus]
MMHPYVVASILVGGAVVCYTAYILYKELTEVPQYEYVFTDGPRAGKDTKWRASNGQTNDYESSEDESLSLVGSEEKSGIRRRKRGSKDKLRKNLSNKSHSDDDEQELLDRLSYLNAVEQEIERKKQQLANEERILSERERDIEKRRQNLSQSTRSSRSSSHSDLWQSINSPIGATHSNHSTTSTSTNGFDDDQHDQPLIIGNPDVNSLHSAPPSAKMTNSSVNEESNSLSDSFAHAVLTQDLSHISLQQQMSDINPAFVIQPPAPYSVASNSTVSSKQSSHNAIQEPEQQLQKQQLMGSKVFPDQSPSLLKSVPTEETWSEIGSVISENLGSIMSSVVDIDMENIEH